MNPNKRKGLIKVPTVLLNDADKIDALLAVFAKFVPAFIKYSDFNFTEYGGYSKEFEEVEMGVPTPVYDAVITNTGTKEMPFYEIEFKKAEDKKEVDLTLN